MVPQRVEAVGSGFAGLSSSERDVRSGIWGMSISDSRLKREERRENVRLGLERMLCVSCHLVQSWERAEVGAPKADTVGSICGGVMVHQEFHIAIVIVNY